MWVIDASRLDLTNLDLRRSRDAQLANAAFSGLRGGASRTRTGDLLGAIQALSQLSYSPAAAKSSRGFATCAAVVWLGGARVCRRRR